MPTAKSGRPDRSSGNGRARRRVDPVTPADDDELAAADDLHDDAPADSVSLAKASSADVRDASDADLDAELDAEDVEDDEDLDDDDLDDNDDLDDDDLDDELDDDDKPAAGGTLTRTRASTRGGATAIATKARPAKPGAKPSKSKPKSKSASKRRDQRSGNPFVALIRFAREVVGEMRKVLWPTRRELVIYTIVVILFVTVMISIVAGLDFGFARLILLVFG